MTRRAEVIAIGSELLGPARVDSNGSFLARRLGEQGIALGFRTIVGDDLADLRAAVTLALGRADVVIATGGLGPTVDDLTREAVAEALGLPLLEDAELVRGIEERFARHGLPMPPSNRRQAMVPRGATVIPNRHGTAPGLLLRSGERILALLPGVPVEMERMVEETLLPLLGAPAEVFATRVFKVSGLTESETDRRLAPAHATAGGVEWTILAQPGQVEIHLREQVAPGGVAAGIERLDAAIAAALGDHLFGRDAETLEGVVAGALVRRGESLAAAESITGGGVARLLTTIPGASRWFRGGAVAYTDDAKRALCGVEAALLATQGAVSEPVARAMAEGIRSRLGATWGIATTGYAGPEGGGPDLPPGTVHIALAGPGGGVHRSWRVPGPRTVVQERAVRSALDMVRRAMTGGDGVRLFVAADLPAAIRGNLAAAQSALRSLSPDVRWVRPEGIHLTLVFLGEVLAARLAGIVAALGDLHGAPADPIPLEARGLGIFPERGRPRVIWAGLTGDLDALGRLQAGVATALREAGLAIEARDWHPHLTLGRVQGGGEAARDAIGPQASVSFGAFEVRAVHLFESELLPGGARYRSLREFPVATAGEGS